MPTAHDIATTAPLVLEPQDGPVYATTMTHPKFHLSLGVKSVEESTDFFVRVLNGSVLHQDPSGYVNVSWGGCQITLQQDEKFETAPPHVHFGVNLSLDDFDRLAAHVLSLARERVVRAPHVIDAETPMERKKMYLRCPSGYLIELKGYR